MSAPTLAEIGEAHRSPYSDETPGMVRSSRNGLSCAVRAPERVSDMDRRTIRGTGALDIARQQDALAMLRRGLTQQQVATALHVSKNVIAGLWQRNGGNMPRVQDKTTMADRLDALHARLDRVLAETRGVGIMPNEPKGRR